MSDYTPTTEEVRIKYRLSSGRQPGDFAEFDRWIAAHDAEKRAEWEAERGEPEWEYGIRAIDDDVPIISQMPTLESAQIRANNIRGGWIVVQRRMAGPWLPAPDSTKTESEDNR